MNFLDNITIIKSNSEDLIFGRLKHSNTKAFYRRGSYSTELIWGDRKFVFPSNKRGANSKDIWIFRSVMNEVKDFCFGKKIVAKKRLPVNYWNPNIESPKGKITATDLDHAYWRIAYLNGYISSKTYEKGLMVKDKSLRLASLANLSSKKEYFVVKKGEVTTKSVVLKFEPVLQRVYDNIRYECFEHMMVMADMLGEDFICYKTDCIYYKDTKKNREIVQVYLDSVSIDWKQLVEIDKPKKEEPIGTNLSTL
jgi:hypothetical protein